MNSTDRSLNPIIVGSLVGGVSGFASILWLMSNRSTLDSSNLAWGVLAVLFVSGIAALFGGMVGLTTSRIGQDLKTGGSMRPYLKTAIQYGAIGLFVLAVQGNRDPLDLVVLPCLSAIAGLVFSCIVSKKPNAPGLFTAQP